MDLIRTVTRTTSLLMLLTAAIPAGAQDNRNHSRPQHQHLVPAALTTSDSGAHATRQESRPAGSGSEALDKDSQQPADPQPYVTYDGAQNGLR
jgi:hypothetical protein